MKVPVLLPNIFNHPFTYESGNLKLSTGDYVNIPFGKSTKIGVVWNEFEQTKKKFTEKKVLKKLDLPSLNIQTINFIKWFSEYNIVPLGMALKLHLLNNQVVEKVQPEDLKKYKVIKKVKEFYLSKEQNNSLQDIIKNDQKFRVHVVQGTTGSGKTIVYFKSLEKKLKEGYQALILLPEIGLTNEFQKKFTEFFGFMPALWHSGVSKKNKKIIWNGLANGEIKVLLGARSSLFLPFANLGIIIIDEEHDQSYKQDEGVIYNARDMAISRASFQNIPINLITAVPSLETFQNIKIGKYKVSRIFERYLGAKHPKHEIIKLKKNKKNWISEEIIERVNYHLNQNDQVLFFVNRRGFAPYVLCKKCLKVHNCPNCSVNLVYHKIKKKLICHYCGLTKSIERNCSNNSKCEYTFSGPGVEKIFEEAKTMFPDKKITILSSDTMKKKNSSNILNDIKKNNLQILVGTQLISKGFHFPHLNCIVVVDLDLTLHSYDLRASEKNLQLFHQLSGRAGRTGKPSKVYFQSFGSSENFINKLTDINPDIFLENELNIRKKNNLPPYERFISIIISGRNNNSTKIFSDKVKNKVEENLNCKVMGPVIAPVFKIKNKFRYRILIRSKKNQQIQKKLSKILLNFTNQKEIKLVVDVDPITFN